MVRTAWELEQHARHVQREAMGAARQRRLLALAGMADGARARDGAGAVAAEVVAGWLEGAAARLRRAGARPAVDPLLAGREADGLPFGC
jgi:hypothetical protein